MRQTCAEPELRFEFGRNWQSFVRTCLNADRIAVATASLQRILATETLRGRSFLDVGCGSGLFSLSAALLGAERVVSFDVDPQSVQASTDVRARAGLSADRWQIRQGSVLDEQFLATLEPADVVYAWGVLHQTGEMWRAIDNIIGRIKPGGVIVLSIYNKVERRIGSSGQWWHIKRWYCRSSPRVRRLIEWLYLSALAAWDLLTLRHPSARTRNYQEQRGMDFRHDVRDWIGGFPYEYATAGEVFTYLHDKSGLQLRFLNTQEGHGCNEFTFVRPPVGA
jgi:2-polyprenyl-6-hydroxyphenyl methylase/3-demethylubiquinone-9 3-methyltransferase